MYHLDSMTPLHKKKAVEANLQRYFTVEWGLCFGESSIGMINMHYPKVPQQPNNYDCGLFVLQSMDEI
ncbi:unnamed protein product [Calypogeia fissa]